MNPWIDVVKPSLRQELLPFIVEVAQEADLSEVAALRASSYGKHLPQVAANLALPERYDHDLACEILVARSKLDGSLLGTMRTHTNALQALPLQHSLQLPEHFEGMRLVEATRLCVKGSPNASLVRSALFKALFQYCEMQGVDWILAAGRRPVDRIYDSLLFTDVGRPGVFYPMAHAGSIPHRVMSLSVPDARRLWSACKHPLYQFVIETTHPDIRLDRARPIKFTPTKAAGNATLWDGNHDSFAMLAAYPAETHLPDAGLRLN